MSFDKLLEAFAIMQLQRSRAQNTGRLGLKSQLHPHPSHLGPKHARRDNFGSQSQLKLACVSEILRHAYSTKSTQQETILKSGISKVM